MPYEATAESAECRGRLMQEQNPPSLQLQAGSTGHEKDVMTSRLDGERDRPSVLPQARPAALLSQWPD